MPKIIIYALIAVACLNLFTKITVFKNHPALAISKLPVLNLAKFVATATTGGIDK
jgi:hypothetical protein